MKVPLIYVAGPFTAATPWEIEQNTRRAEDVGAEIVKLGGWPVIPHANTRYFHGMCDPQLAYDGTMRMLEGSDALVALPGWTKSNGATREVQVAECSMMVPVFYAGSTHWREDVADFIEAHKSEVL